MTLRSLWNNYLTNGWKGLPETQLLRLKLVNAFSLVGVASFLIFGLMNALGSDANTGFAELFFAFIATLNIVYLRGSGNTDVAAKIVLVIMIISFGLLFANGGIARTGWLWFFTFPPVAFFLKGQRTGWKYVGALLVSLFSVIVAHYFFGSPLAYSYVEIRQFTVSFLSPIFLIYLYVQLNELQNQKLVEKTAALEFTNHELKTEIKKRERVETTLKNQNQFLENIKAATLNILEDLKKEKDDSETAKLKNEALVENIGEGIIATDENLCITTMNSAAGKILSFDTKKTIGKKIYDLWDMTDESGKLLELENRPIFQALSGKKNFSNKYSYISSTGEKIPVSSNVTPIRSGKKIIGVIDAFRDITKEREIDRAKSEFVSLASHQLRSPLTATKWSAELLASSKNSTLTAVQRKLLHNIYSSNERMIKLVSALLNVSRIDMGTFVVEPTLINLPDLTDGIVKELAHLITNKKIQLEKKYDQTLPKIKVDSRLLNNVLSNLLTNAINYTPANGKIKIAIYRRPRSITISVADNGYGIPKYQQKNIFTKFFRADNIRTKVTEGTGLGLYIVKSIIERTGGKVSFESEENKGSTFYITLPLTGMKEKAGSTIIPE